MPFTSKDWRDAPGDLTTPISASAMEDLEARLSAYTDQVVAAVVPPALPSGLVQWFAGSTAPTGWLAANGAAVSRTTYAALYSALGGAGSPHGQGNGSTTFNVPDLRDRAPVGSGSTYTLGAAGGAATVTLTAAQMPSHTHTGPSHTHTGPSHTHTGAAHTHTGPSHSHNFTLPATTSGAVTQNNPGNQFGEMKYTNTPGTTSSWSGGATSAAGTGATGSTASGASSASGTGATAASGTAATGSAGSDGSHANLPPYLALLPIIKT